MKIFPKFLVAFVFLYASVLLHGCSEKNKDGQQTTATDTLKLFSGNEYAAVDQSPVDISYYPQDYPQNRVSARIETALPVARIIYSRPHKKGRVIFSDNQKSLCPYGKPWRLGANEATEISFYKPVIINGKNVAAGRYVLYCIPFADKWTIALNSNVDSWGLQIEPLKDMLRIEVPVQKQNTATEDFTIIFAAASYGADIIFVWDNVKTVLPVSFSK
jgi:Protein of unknown function (DUF2911)